MINKEEYTTVRVHKNTLNKLKEACKKTETYDELINKLLEV